jgi:hypothetical protein
MLRNLRRAGVEERSVTFPIHRTMFALGTTLAVFTIAMPYRNGAWLDPATTVSALGLSLNLGLGPVMGLLHVAKAAPWRGAPSCGGIVFQRVVSSRATAVCARRRHAYSGRAR